jgi:hypothetical protein
MHRLIVMMTLALAALWSQPSLAQSRSQLALCTTDTTPADAQVAACNKIIALKALSGQQLAADADPRSRRGRVINEEHAGAVVELVAARRGLSRGPVSDGHFFR